MKKILPFFIFLFIPLALSAQDNSIPVGSIVSTHANIYGDMFEGRKTANGEIFNNDSLTCSHRTLPFNTMLYITNAVNGNTIILRVNDRGINPKSNDIFITKMAANRLGFPRHGGIKVTMQIIGKDGIVMQEDEKPMTYEQDVLRQNNLRSRKYNSRTEESPKDQKYNFEINTIEDNNNDPAISKTYTLNGKESQPEGYGVQLFSVDNIKTAQEITKNLVEENIESQLFIQQVWVKGKKVFRIIAGEYNLEEAKNHLAKLKKVGHKGFIQKHLS